MNVVSLAAIMSAVLISAGIVQVFWQMRSDEARRRGSQVADIARTGVKIRTAFPGITMICVGFLLFGIVLAVEAAN